MRPTVSHDRYIEKVNEALLAELRGDHGATAVALRQLDYAELYALSVALQELRKQTLKALERRR